MSRIIQVNGKDRNLKGWQRNRPDPRDVHFMKVHKSITPQEAGYTVADMSNNEQLMPAVFDQGELGACTANGWIECMEYLYARACKPLVPLSRLFLYYTERVMIDGTPAEEDSGAQIRDGAKALAQIGAPPESLWPYNVAQFAQKPPQAAFDAAAAHKAIRYYSLSTLDWIKACLTLGFPAVFGFAVPQSFVDDTGKTGQFSYQPGESIVGGHCVVAIGHMDGHANPGDGPGAFLCRNSWGEDWGLKGNFWLPYSAVLSEMASDFFTLHQEGL